MDIGSGEGEGERDVDEPPQMADFSIKALKLSGLTVELGNEHVQDTKLNGMYVRLTVKLKRSNHLKLTLILFANFLTTCSIIIKAE